MFPNLIHFECKITELKCSAVTFGKWAKSRIRRSCCASDPGHKWNVGKEGKIRVQVRGQELEPGKFELPTRDRISSFFKFCKANASEKDPTKKERGLKNSNKT